MSVIVGDGSDNFITLNGKNTCDVLRAANVARKCLVPYSSKTVIQTTDI